MFCRVEVDFKIFGEIFAALPRQFFDAKGGHWGAGILTAIGVVVTDQSQIVVDKV